MYICDFIVTLEKRSVRSIRKIERGIEIVHDVLHIKTKSYSVQILENGKYRPEKAPYLNTFHTVVPSDCTHPDSSILDL